MEWCCPTSAEVNADFTSGNQDCNFHDVTCADLTVSGTFIPGPEVQTNSIICEDILIQNPTTQMLSSLTPGSITMRDSAGISRGEMTGDVIAMQSADLTKSTFMDGESIIAEAPGVGFARLSTNRMYLEEGNRHASFFPGSGEISNGPSKLIFEANVLTSTFAPEGKSCRIGPGDFTATKSTGSTTIDGGTITTQALTTTGSAITVSGKVLQNGANTATPANTELATVGTVKGMITSTSQVQNAWIWTATVYEQAVVEKIVYQYLGSISLNSSTVIDKSFNTASPIFTSPSTGNRYNNILAAVCPYLPANAALTTLVAASMLEASMFSAVTATGVVTARLKTSTGWEGPAILQWKFTMFD